MNLCVSCKKEIEVGARRCHHCQSYQGHMRYLNFGNTVMALVVALVSVVAVGGPVIVDMLKSDSSDISISMLLAESVDYGDEEVAGFSFQIRNKGKKAGVIRSAIFAGRLEDGKTFSMLMKNAEEKGSQVLYIKENSSRVYFLKPMFPFYTYTYNGDDPPEDLSRSKKKEKPPSLKECSFLFQVITSEGISKPTIVEISTPGWSSEMGLDSCNAVLYEAYNNKQYDDSNINNF